MNFDKFRDTAPLSSMTSSISGPIYFFFSSNMLIHWWYFHSFGVWDFSLSNSCIEGYSEEIRAVGGCSGLFRGVPGLGLVIQTYTDTRNGCPLDAGRYKVGSIAFSIALRSVTIHFLHMSMIASPRMSETEGKVSLITLYTHWRADSFSESNILQ